MAYVTALFLLARLGGALFVRLFHHGAGLAAEALSAIHICTLALIPWGCSTPLWTDSPAWERYSWPLPLSAFRKAVYFIALFAPAVVRRPGRILRGTHLRHRGAGGEHRSLCPVHPADSGFPADPPAAENKSTLPS